MLRHFVEFYFEKQTISVEILKRDINKIRIPDEAFAYRFFDKSYEKIGDNTEIISKINLTEKKYVSDIITVASFKRLYPEKTGLIALFERKGWKIVAKTRSGIWVSWKSEIEL